MTPEEKARLEALEAENTKLKAAQVQFAEAEKKRTADARNTANSAFAETLVTAGKLLPVQKAVLVATLNFMENQDTVVNFGEGAEQKPLAAAMKDMFTAMPKIVEYSEIAGDKTIPTGKFTTAPGYTVDKNQLDDYAKILAYQEKHGVTFEVAMMQFSSSH